MIKPQLIAMLDYLGVPFRDQPKNVGEKKYLLDKYQKLDPEKYKEAYSIIVQHRIPEHLVGDAKAVQASKVAELVEGVWESEKNKISMHATNKTDEAIKALRSEYRNSMQNIEKDARTKAEEAIKEASKRFVTHQVKIGDAEPTTIHGVVPEYFDTMLQLAAQRMNILLVGPAGCGKTHTAAQLAEALNLDYASQSCSAGVSESVFTGWLLPTGENGKFSHAPSAFLNIYEHGGVFLLDELDASDPNTAVFLNQALANDGFFLPQRFDNPRVNKHKDFIAVGAANTYGGGADAMYHARNALDASTLDRFRMGTIPVGYSAVVEESLVDGEVLEWGRRIRAAIESHRMRKIMSTRVMLDATEMKRAQDWDMKKINGTYFADWSKEERLMIGGIA